MMASCSVPVRPLLPPLFSVYLNPFGTQASSSYLLQEASWLALTLSAILGPSSFSSLDHLAVFKLIGMSLTLKARRRKHAKSHIANYVKEPGPDPRCLRLRERQY